MERAIPHWLALLATASLAVAVACALVIAGDLAWGRRQKMWIMNLVWPLTALYAGPMAVWAYWRLGRREIGKPFWQQVALGATHCGSGCALGDIVAEWITFIVPLTLFGTPLFATWAIDYVLAFAFGIAFQYFTIAPMRGLSLGEGLRAAVKADALSLTAWQVGMYGWMAIAKAATAWPRTAAAGDPRSDIRRAAGERSARARAPAASRQRAAPETDPAQAGLLPFDRRGGLGGDIVGDAVDAAHLVDDPVRDASQQLVRQRGPVRGHEIRGLHCAQRDHVIVSPAVAHHPNRLHRQEDGERLCGLVVPPGLPQLFDEDRVRLLQ